MGDITLHTVRNLANTSMNNWIEIRHDEKRQVIFFRHLDEACPVRRVIVYYERAVISVVVHDPTEKKNAFLYRANADNNLLGRLLHSPLLYKVFGFRLGRDVDELRNVDLKKKNADTGTGRNDNDIMDDAQQQLRVLEDKIKELKIAQKNLQARVMKESKKDRDVWRPMLRSYVRDEVLRELRCISMDTLECLQLTPDGAGVVHSESDGQVYWTTTIGWDVGNCLRSSIARRRPESLCLGTHDRYFVRFSTGEVECSGPKELKELVALGDVRMVAFGRAADSYVVLFECGGTAWHNIPKGLRRLLSQYGATKPAIDFISIGVAGEYFVRHGNSVHYGNLSKQAKKALDDCPGLVKEVTFGAGDALIARYVVQQ